MMFLSSGDLITELANLVMREGDLLNDDTPLISRLLFHLNSELYEISLQIPADTILDYLEMLDIAYEDDELFLLEQTNTYFEHGDSLAFAYKKALLMAKKTQCKS